METYKAKVLKKEYLEDKAVELTIKVEKSFEFIPGQYIIIKDKISNQLVSRAYSIASSPTLLKHANMLRLCIKKKEGGLYSTFVYDEMKEGHLFEIIGPFGNFTIDKAPTKKYYFIAAGSGIAPFVSMISYLLEKKDYEKITLIYGNKYESDIIYHSKWKELAKASEKFVYIPVLSREQKPGYFYGHVQDVLKNIDKEGSYFVCGMPKMVEEVKNIVSKKNAFVIGEGY